MPYRVSDQTLKILKKGLQREAEPFRFLMRCIEVITITVILAGFTMIYFNLELAGILMITGGLILYGFEELFLQKRSTIVRIYGPLGRMRYVFEQEFRDKFLQYFNERNTDGRPIPEL